MFETDRNIEIKFYLSINASVYNNLFDKSQT